MRKLSVQILAIVIAVMLAGTAAAQSQRTEHTYQLDDPERLEHFEHSVDLVFGTGNLDDQGIGGHIDDAGPKYFNELKKKQQLQKQRRSPSMIKALSYTQKQELFRPFFKF